jgi:DNA N-6-adenine-methyltransferase (Dam)
MNKMGRALARPFHEPSIGKTDDWFTPHEIFAALGLTFDLDVAHPGVGTPHCCVPALKIYTIADDGLAHPWFGLVFMNPPFGIRNSHVSWLRKFFVHGSGIAIVRAYTSSGWWHAEMPKAEMILFPKGKTKFVRPDGSIGKEPGHGIVLVGMGEVACETLLASGLGMTWDRRVKTISPSREIVPAMGEPEPSPTIREATTMATRIKAVEQVEPKENDEPMSITKPEDEFDLDRFKSKRGAAMANIETLQNTLPILSIAEAKDFVRLHEDEKKYWSAELCFVSVPIKGSKREQLHLIDEDLAMRYLPSGRIQRFKLVLASKPNDVFFLCKVPTRNLDNSYNASNVEACEQAKTLWTQATSRRDEGVEAYKIDVARDQSAFAAPNWPSLSLSQAIGKAFPGRQITCENHPGLLRLIGAKPMP